MSESLFLKSFDLLATATGGVARLRELIFTLAVQGKLVPQGPSDEPASELLKKSRADKVRLIAEGTIKREKPLTVIAADEKTFELPLGWEWVRIGQVASRVQYGLTASADHSVAHPKLLRITDIQKDRVNWDTVPGVLVGSQDISGYFLADGDLLIARTGGTIGKSFLVDSVPVDSVFASYLIRISPLQGLSPQYLKTFASSGHYWSQVLAKSMGTGQPNVNGTALSELVLGLPPLAEQTRIVTRVEELMKLCDALERNGRLADEQHARLTTTLFGALAASESAHALAENWQRVAESFDLLLDRPTAVDALEQTILQLAVRGMLVPQDEADPPAKLLLQCITTQKRNDESIGEDFSNAPYETPENWEWCKLELIAQVGTGTTPSREVPEYFSPTDVPWVTSGETGNSHIRETQQFVSKLALTETSLKVYPIGTLIVAMYGQGKTRGQVAELLIPAATNQACAAIVLHEKSEGHRGYVKLFFEKSYDEIRLQAAGGAQPNLNIGKIKSTLIPLPPLNEQLRIVRCVKQLRVLCTELRGRILDLHQTQSTLAGVLSEMATGT
jgi:type I restriction enzyme S subunit